MINNIQTINTGKYDTLYNSVEYLWAPHPGRMVKRIVELNICPGKALDLGCGDGKNILFLEQNGWTVDGVDISKIAIIKAKKRILEINNFQRGMLHNLDAMDFPYRKDSYKLIISYGLFHCINDIQLNQLLSKIDFSLMKGGYFVFATFNNELPLPPKHGTEELYLRNKNYIIERLRGWIPLEVIFDFIEESHIPIIGLHKHSLTWGLYRKPY